LIGIGQALSNEGLMDVRTDTFYDVALGSTQLHAHGYIWTERLIDVKFPKDWWQAIKDRFLPQWLRSRFPIKYTHIDGRAYYPKLGVLSDSDDRYTYVRHFEARGKE